MALTRGDFISISPSAARCPSGKDDSLDKEKVPECFEAIADIRADVEAYYKGKWRNEFKTSNVPMCVAETANILFRPSRGKEEDLDLFLFMAQEKPEYASCLFARQRAKDKLRFSDVVGGKECLHLLSNWCKEFRDGKAPVNRPQTEQTTSTTAQIGEGQAPPAPDRSGKGAERLARLMAGAEAFAAYLDNQDLPSYDFDHALQQLHQGCSQWQKARQQLAERKKSLKSILENTLCIPPVLEPMASAVIRPLLKAEADIDPYYHGCAVGMIVGGTVLFSQEKIDSIQNKGDHAIMVLGVLGAIVGVAPVGGAAGSLATTLGITITQLIVQHRQKKYTQLEHTARHFANAMILDDLDGTTDVGNIIMVALNIAP